jgi:hypothetical protein
VAYARIFSNQCYHLASDVPAPIIEVAFGFSESGKNRYMYGTITAVQASFINYAN